MKDSDPEGARTTSRYKRATPTQPHDRQKISSSFIDELEKKRGQRLRRRLQWIASAVGAFSGLAGGVYQAVKTQVQNQIEEALEQHEILKHVGQDEALEAFSRKLKQLERLTQEKQVGLRKELQELYRFKVGEKAAELERDRSLKARTALHARERFDRYVQSGDSLDAAYRKAAGTGL